MVVRREDKILVGNWMDDAFCESLGTYDTILADYLIGAVDGFSPFEQGQLIPFIATSDHWYVEQTLLFKGKSHMTKVNSVTVSKAEKAYQSKWQIVRYRNESYSRSCTAAR